MRRYHPFVRSALSHLAGLHPLLAGVPRPLRLGVANRIAVCREHDFICFRIPKAANSTVTRTLALHAFPQQSERILADRTGNVAKAAFSALPAAGGVTAAGLRRRYRLVSFFRDPYARVLSAYLDKMQSSNRRRYAWVAEHAGVASPESLSFAGFIEFLEQGGLYADAHWAPQTMLCPVPIEQLDIAGKVENLEADLKRAVEEIFGPGKWQGMALRSHNRQHADRQRDTYYTDELTQRVRKLYAADFELLGYGVG